MNVLEQKEIIFIAHVYLREREKGLVSTIDLRKIFIYLFI